MAMPLTMPRAHIHPANAVTRGLDTSNTDPTDHGTVKVEEQRTGAEVTTTCARVAIETMAPTPTNTKMTAKSPSAGSPDMAAENPPGTDEDQLKTTSSRRVMWVKMTGRSGVPPLLVLRSEHMASIGG